MPSQLLFFAIILLARSFMLTFHIIMASRQHNFDVDFLMRERITHFCALQIFSEIFRRQKKHSEHEFRWIQNWMHILHWICERLKIFDFQFNQFINFRNWVICEKSPKSSITTNIRTFSIWMCCEWINLIRKTLPERQFSFNHHIFVCVCSRLKVVVWFAHFLYVTRQCKTKKWDFHADTNQFP